MYRISAQDNGLFFFRDRSDLRRCPSCGELLSKWDENLSDVPLASVPKNDVSYSYDGVLVVSKKMRDAVLQANLVGLTFRPLKKDLFSATAEHTVKFDWIRRGTRFENRCSVCGRYESIIGVTPVFLLAPIDILPNGFARTDLEFGARDEKSPVLLCGDDAARHLKKARLRGLTLVSEKI